MAYTSPAVRRTALLASAIALLSALTACGDGGGGTATTATRPSPAAPTRTTSPATGRSPAPADSTGTPRDTAGTPSDTAGSASASARADGRCHTSALRASVGRMDPGAGQRNFPVVLTNISSHTCTLYGYPGLAFTDAAGRQLGPDPKRTPASPETVRLVPGASAWAALSFADPGISGARTADPATLLVTPPDERHPLKVAWTAGEVPVSGGDRSAVSVTVLSPGEGP
ncbi:DUF4232 domain-containing protein [Streptomyces fumanus]|uniref:Lipoprotein n=1 Tax=Streptomyces fumanus TaxID=67302 RepID=A0A919E174_9ACTN|nr:DUF4232 domain-containing protein [Streptomyces fumanus]GHF00284.1 lipoprotein [Streptomyces fumanus]